jgi:hypothetical protein
VVTQAYIWSDDFGHDFTFSAIYTALEAQNDSLKLQLQVNETNTINVLSKAIINAIYTNSPE